jgi:hypothetical protein
MPQSTSTLEGPAGGRGNMDRPKRILEALPSIPARGRAAGRGGGEMSWSVGNIREGHAGTRRLVRAASAPTERVQLSSVRRFVSESVYVKFRFGPTII